MPRSGHARPPSAGCAERRRAGGDQPRQIANSLPGSYGARSRADGSARQLSTSRACSASSGNRLPRVHLRLDALALVDSESSNMQDYVAPAGVRRADVRGARHEVPRPQRRRHARPRRAWASALPDLRRLRRRRRARRASRSRSRDDEGNYVIDDIRRRAARTSCARSRSAKGDSRRAGSARSRMLARPAASATARRAVPVRLGSDQRRRRAVRARTATSATGLRRELTVRKELVPTDDPGRFDLLVDDQIVLSQRAGDGGNEDHRAASPARTQSARRRCRRPTRGVEYDPR